MLLHCVSCIKHLSMALWQLMHLGTWCMPHEIYIYYIYIYIYIYLLYVYSYYIYIHQRVIFLLQFSYIKHQKATILGIYHGRRKQFELKLGGLTFSNFSDTFFYLRKTVISQTLRKCSMAAITINWLYTYISLNPQILNFV